jgi:D-Tyr-tRNAtyr deacylase
LVLAGVGKGDDEKEADSLISRIIRCRLWPDDSGKQVSDRSYYSLTGTIGTNEVLLK